MLHLAHRLVVFCLLTTFLNGGTAEAQPSHTTYQGELRVAGAPFNGLAQFKFAIVWGGSNKWANDGTAVGEPGQSVPLTVTDGLFSVRLGDTSLTGMTTAITADALQTTSAVFRVWVDTGGGFVQLPDVPVSSSPFALQSESAKRAAAGFTIDGDLQIFEDSGQRTVYVNADEGTTGALVMIYDLDSQGVARPAIELDSREGSGGGLIRLFNGEEGGANPNQATVEINAREGTGPGQITLFDDAGNVAIQLDAEMPDGHSRIIADIVQINGGMDVSERFSIEESTEEIQPGYVVSISTEEIGGLTLSRSPYDSRVAGIVSGAGGINVGLVLGQEGQPFSGDHPVALSGRVYCWADASHDSIEPGDLLTTSATPGHAMKANDPARAYGTIIGKAMTPLAEGTGLVLVLVSLQ